MSDERLRSWFLGPKAENADVIGKYIIEGSKPGAAAVWFAHRVVPLNQDG